MARLGLWGLSPRGALTPGAEAALTCVLRGAHARVVVDSVDTGGVVLAVVVLAVVKVDLARVALEALCTHTP